MRAASRALLVTLLLAPLAAQCGVNPKDGNYYVSYRDVQLPGGPAGLKLVRSYNSVARQVGWLGVGWGTPFETRVVLQADGSAAVHENGSGAITRYRLVQGGTGPARDTPAQAASAAPTAWQGEDCDEARLERRETSYLRTECDGAQETFALGGHWLSKRFASGALHTAEWGDNQRPTRIGDQAGQVLAFEWSPQGQATRVSVNGDAGIRYTYDDAGRLASTSGYQDSPAYRFSYSDAGLLAGIHYIDTTRVELEYTAGGRVQTLTGRLGERETYSYVDTVPGYPSLVETLVVKVDEDGVERQRMRHVYNVKLDRLARLEGGSVSRAYRYDRQGQLTSVRIAGQGDLYLRHDRQQRITRLHVATAGSVGRTLHFGYAPDGRVAWMTLRGRAPVRLSYSPQGEAVLQNDPVAMATLSEIAQALNQVRQLLPDPRSARLPL